MSDMHLKIGQRVYIIGKKLTGYVAYVGFTNFASGKWVGIVLDKQRGKNNGSVRGTNYFKCATNYGIFVRPTQLVIMEQTASINQQIPEEDQEATTTAVKDSSSSSSVYENSSKVVAKMRQITTTRTETTDQAITVPTMSKNSITTERDDKIMLNLSIRSDLSGNSNTDVINNKTETTNSIDITTLTSDRSTNSAMIINSTMTANPEVTTTKSLTTTTKTMTTTKTTRSTSSTQLRLTKINQPKPTGSNQHNLVLAIPFTLAPKRSKTSVSPTGSFCCSKRPSFMETGFLEILRPQFIPGQTLCTPMTVAPSIGSTQEFAISEVQQLREELDFLRTQHHHDKRKLHELEKLRIQNEQLQDFKCKIMSQYGLLQRELQRSRQELLESHDLAAKYKRELDETAECIELLTLDKEMAEERAETLQIELEIVQEHNDELGLDIEILRAEQEGKSMNSDANKQQFDNLHTATELIRLEQYNQRLRDTVIKLRDTLAKEKQELQKANKDLETKCSEISELKKIKEILTQRVDAMEIQIIELHEQIDSSLGAETMVTSLSELKLDLEERIKLLEEEVKELEALEEIHEQLLESNQELEGEMREEIEHLCMCLKNSEQQKEAAMESVYDREVTINKFRELVRNLNEQLQLKDVAAVVSIEDISSNNSETQSNDFQHVFSNTKAYSRAIEQQLKTMELKLQSKHIDYLIAFVPEDFMLRGGEHDVLLVLLLLQRFGEKIDIICSAINEKFLTVCEFGRNAIFEGYAVQRFGFRSKSIFILKSLKLVLEQMLYGLNHCDYEVCTHVVIYRLDLEAQEQHIDEFLCLLKAGLLDEHTPCEALEGVLYYINGLHQNLLTPQTLTELIDEQQLYRTLLEIFETGIDCVNTNAGLLHTIIQLGDEQTDSFQCMQFLMENSCNLKQKLKKLQRRISGDKAQVWTGMQSLRYKEIQETTEILRELINILAVTAKEASKDGVAITHDKLWPILCLQYNKNVNITRNNQPTSQTIKTFSEQCIQHLEHQICQLIELLESQENVRSPNVHTVCVRHPTTNALQQRAALMRQHYEDVKSLEQMVNEREKEIKSLKYVAKMKQQNYSELQIRKEMAEKQLIKLNNAQMELLGQLANCVQQMEQQLLTKEATFINALNSLSEKLNNLEHTQIIWQEQLLTTNAHVTTSTVASNVELQMLHTTLRQERNQRSQVQGAVLSTNFKRLTPIYVPQRLSANSAKDLCQLEHNLHVLKRQWILAHITLDNDDASHLRQLINANSTKILRHICEVYCNKKPHRAAHTDFAFFASADLRRALIPN